MPRDDSAIHSHLRKHHHPLGALPSGMKWWLKVHTDMKEAGLYYDLESGTHSHPADNKRKSVIAWLDKRILPALAGGPPASAASADTAGPGTQHPPKGTGPGHDLIAGRRTAKGITARTLPRNGARRSPVQSKSRRSGTTSTSSATTCRSPSRTASRCTSRPRPPRTAGTGSSSRKASATITRTPGVATSTYSSWSPMSAPP
jgi:hypothetical protein